MILLNYSCIGLIYFLRKQNHNCLINMPSSIVLTYAWKIFLGRFEFISFEKRNASTFSGELVIFQSWLNNASLL